jgi:hypothetical protein
MKKKITLLSLLVMVILFAGIANLMTDSSRSEYEKYLLSQANVLKSKAELSESPKKAFDMPEMAAFDEFVKTMDPALGYVPKERLWGSYLQTRELQKELESDRSKTDIEWEGTIANMGGRTRALMFDPNDPVNRKVWAGGVTGGLWYNEDIWNINDPWMPVGDFWSNLAISCITFDPNQPQILYVGTGEAQTARIIYRESSGLGAGIFRSIDGGETWEQIPSTLNFKYITDLEVRNEGGNSVIYACVVSGTYKGIDHLSQPSDGLYRSDDGGTSWDQVLPEIIGYPDEIYAPADIEIASNGRIYIGTMENLNLNGGATILYSDTGLEGSWSIFSDYNIIIDNDNLYNVPARTNVAVAPSDPEIVYAQFAAGYMTGVGYYNYKGRYIIKSQNGGASWFSINIPYDDDWAVRAWHNFILRVDPFNPSVIFSGGIDLWKSMNSGVSWNHVSDWSDMYSGGGDEYVHADQHNIKYQPGSNTTAVFSSDGGVFLSVTADYSYPIFIERNQEYNTLQNYTCAINPIAGTEEYLGGMQDNGTILYQGEPFGINDMISGGDGAYCFYDEDEPSIFLTSSQYSNYTTWQNGNPKDSFYGYYAGGATFICPADYNYKENTLYCNGVFYWGANADHIYRVTNIPLGVAENMVYVGTNSLVPFSHVKYSEYSPPGTATLFLGTQSGGLYKVENAESSPQSTDITGDGFPTANISCVAIGSSEDVLAVTFSNYGVSSVWFTTDGGDSWVEKEGSLPDMPIRWAIFHPDNDGQLMLATETGIWATNMLLEDETIWYPANEGMANVRVDMLKLRKSDNTVLAATHGRGLFTTTYEFDQFFVGTEELEADETIFDIYPNPAINVVNLHFDHLNNQKVNVMLRDMSGKLVYQEKVSLQNGSSIVKLDIDYLKNGLYFVSVHADRAIKTRKLIIQ